MSSNPENSGVNANNNTGTGNADAITGAQQNMVLQPRQLQEMAAKFRTLLTEARNVGETTPRGKELMFQAAKIKQVYDALTLNRRRQQAAQAYNNTSNPNSSNPASIPTENVPNSSQQQQQQQQQTRNNSNKFSNMIKQVLTPEENQEYEKLWQNFQVRHTSIKEKETYLKQNIDRLEQEINKQTDEGPKQQLQEKKIELLNDWKVLKIEYTKLFNNYQNSKKTFYVECARHNPALHKFLQESTQQQRVQQQRVQQQQQQQHHHHQHQNQDKAHSIASDNKSSQQHRGPHHKKIIHGPYRLLRLLPHASRPIMSRILQVDPKKRATLDDIFNDEWFAAIAACTMDSKNKVIRAPGHHHTLVREENAHLETYKV